MTLTKSNQKKRAEPEALMVLLSDRISDLVKKGEVTDRYYNPGNTFKNVHLVLMNDDQPDRKALQKMVGTAKLTVHNIPFPLPLYLLSYFPFAYYPWYRKVYALARELRPQLIRCHGNRINGYFAAQLKRRLGIPYVVSMHINPDADLRRLFDKETPAAIKWFYRFLKPIEKTTIGSCDVAICVYQFIEPYAKQLGAPRIETIYNVINPTSLLIKNDYACGSPVRVLITGRQFKEKNPLPLIEAVAQIPEVELTLIGNGELHEKLKTRALELGISDRCLFLPSVPNDELCKQLKTYDIFVSINHYGGISKAELEAMLVGLPIITNRHPLESVPELLGELCVVVEDDTDSYREALKKLIASQALREYIGRGARNANQEMTPERMENKTVKLYEEILQRSHA